ncbi:tetratricopeptide repeat protein [Azospirillum picis]|uniref:Glycosyltransferase involved in cell wall biosynthesis n=1 Tax=Azospirillum picis TaxID=488438 RepID=A0ABU0MGY7_9PROT|nr:tetratricopeptide repeat protein [Azospirillum picis]MBP2299043.1 glycosyltransferase involved in cell wall biosynthesis [Azospirillum picis]MDQ0532715.1 glycosyltransferase involved in cell wall biosynthesis [Azospirillum picis]
MDQIEQTLAVATEHHRAGRTAEAERLYRAVLDASPGHPDALHLLGVIALQSGQPAEAVDRIGQAVAADESSPLFHANLGHALHASGRHRDAALSFARALALLTNQGEGWGNIGALANLIRRYDDDVRREAAAEVDAKYAMGDVMRRQSLLFLLTGDIAHYHTLVTAVLDDPLRFSVPSLHYAYWGIAMRLFQGEARSGDLSAFVQGDFRQFYRMLVEETGRRYGLDLRLQRVEPRPLVRRVALVTNQMLGEGHQPTADAFDYARRLQDEEGCEVLIVNPNAMAMSGENGFVPEYSYNVTEEYDGEQVIEAHGARVRMVSFPQPRFDEEKLTAVTDAVERFDPDVVVAFGGSNVVADLFASVRPVVLVPTSSGLPPSLAALLLGYAPEDDASGWPEEERERFRHFSFGWALPDGGAARSRADFGLPDEGPLYVVVGNRLDQDVSATFLDTLDRLLDRVPDARIVFAGAARDLPARLAAARNGSRMLAPGHVDGIRSLYALATAYLNPPRQGGGGSAAFALAEGLPVVSFAGGDVSAVAGTGFIVADDASFLDRAAALAENATMRVEAADLARKRFAETGDRSRSVKQLLEYAREAQGLF